VFAPRNCRPEDNTGRDLRAITADGVFFSAMVGMGETYVPAFVLAVGLGEVVAGLVATLPMLVGAVFQLITPWAVRHLQSYRRWVVLCAGLQALSLTPLATGAALGYINIEWLALSTVLYWAFGMATSPAWNAWVTSLVPQRGRAQFFARRTRASQATLLGAILFGGLSLQWGRDHGAELSLFACLFAAAMLARMLSARCLARQSEAPGLAEAHRALSPREILKSVRHANSGRVLAYLLGMTASVHIAAPFFTPYMLGPLALSYAQYMLLTGASFLARVAVLPLVGRIAHRRGTRLLLWWGAVGIVPLPMLWLVSHNFSYLLGVQIFAGSAWAALEFATLLTFFEGIEESERTSLLSAYNLAHAAAIAVGVLLGTQLLVHKGGAGYVWLFAISSGARFGMLLVLRGMAPARQILQMRFRTLAVRPSAGAVERPILATVDDDASGTPG